MRRHISPAQRAGLAAELKRVGGLKARHDSRDEVMRVGCSLDVAGFQPFKPFLAIPIPRLFAWTDMLLGLRPDR